MLFFLLDLKPEFPGLEGVGERSFQDDEYGSDFIILMVDQYRTTPLFYVDNTRRIAFVFSISDRNERTRIQSITDQPLKVFEVVSKFPVL